MQKAWWWDQRREQLAGRLPYSSGQKYKSTELAWVPKDEYRAGSNHAISVFRNREPPEQKPVQHVVRRIGQQELPPNEIFHTRRLALCLSPDQKKILHCWFGISRYSYNKALDLVCKEHHKATADELEQVILPSVGQLREDQKTKKRPFRWHKVMERTPWLLDHKLCPHGIKVEAIRAFCKAYRTTGLSLKAKGKDSTAFQMHHRSRNDKRQTVVIPVGGSGASGWLESEGVRLRKRHPIGVLKPRRKKDYDKLQLLLADQAAKYQKKKRKRRPNRTFGKRKRKRKVKQEVLFICQLHSNDSNRHQWPYLCCMRSKFPMSVDSTVHSSFTEPLDRAAVN
jgi:hypothetical protein